MDRTDEGREKHQGALRHIHAAGWSETRAFCGYRSSVLVEPHVHALCTTHRAPGSAKLKGSTTSSKDRGEVVTVITAIKPAVEADLPVACASLVREAHLTNVVIIMAILLVLGAPGEVSPAGMAGSNVTPNQ